MIPLAFTTGNPRPNASTNLPSTFITIQHKKIALLLDTGESHAPLTLSESMVSHLKHRSTQQEECGKTFSGKLCMPIVIIPSLYIGSFKFTNVKVEVMQHLWDTQHQKGFKATQASKNGVIGLKLLQHFNLLLNYKQHQAILFKRGGKPHGLQTALWVSYPMSTAEGNITTIGTYHNKPLKLYWDTGAIPSKMSTQIKLTSCSKRSKDFQTIGTSCGMNEVGSIKIGQNYLPSTAFDMMKIPSFAPFDGLIGSNFYSHHMVFFDFSHMKIYVKSYLT